MQSFQSVLWCSLFVAIVVLLTLFIHTVFHRWWQQKCRSENNEFTGILFGAISLLYSLIIAFLIVAVWEDYEELNQTIETEADKLNDIIVHAAVLPDSLRKPVNLTIAHYCQQIIHDWASAGADSYHQVNAVSQLHTLLLRTQPQSHFEENVFDDLDSDLSAISDLRRERVNHVHSHVPTLVWLILLTGSVLMIVFSFFISTECIALRRVGISFLAALVAMSIFLVYSLDHPFTSSMQQKNDPYQKIILMLNR